MSSAASSPTPSAPSRLHRRTRRIEDLVSVLLAVLLLGAGLIATAVAAGTYGGAQERIRAESTERHPTTARLVADVGAAGTEPAVLHPARVEWIGRDGRPRTGHTPVGAPGRAGDPIEIWTTADERPVPPPLTDLQAGVAAVVAWVMAAAIGAGVVFAIGRLLFRWTAARYARAWAQDWSDVEPAWTGRALS
ncbi:Rv1733c family protein [Pseudonocardia parietis]|uniref:Integral membrane protein n=1 Tax=Pseudonocardia parietis TaxID=570936 RepID=A0ABS4VW48_9PSEU|nr:hypothetical protein [Pseudonocardia parietis]MBP2368165.1 hypothetical protein [Pseudonocardia parietis]